MAPANGKTPAAVNGNARNLYAISLPSRFALAKPLCAGLAFARAGLAWGSQDLGAHDECESEIFARQGGWRNRSWPEKCLLLPASSASAYRHLAIIIPFSVSSAASCDGRNRRFPP
jgi:hypothetical protein